jgi:hypothetical protein
MWKCSGCGVLCTDDEESCWQCSTKKSMHSESTSLEPISEEIKNNEDENTRIEIPPGKKYKHTNVLTHKEAVAWLVTEARTSDRLVVIVSELADADQLYKFKKFFVPKSFSREEWKELSVDLMCDFAAKEIESNSWEWIDVVKDAFLALGDKTNVKKVEEAIVAEFGQGEC